MFGSGKKKDDMQISQDIETVIGRNTEITGEIGGSGNLRVDGRVKGGLTLTGNVIIGESGVVEGDISAENLSISGNVQGNVNLRGSLTIHSVGQLIGDVTVKSFNIEEGGVFKGRSEMVTRGEERAYAVAANSEE